MILKKQISKKFGSSVSKLKKVELILLGKSYTERDSKTNF